MLRLQRILVPSDLGPCTSLALSHAYALAEQNGSEVHLVNADAPLDAVADDPVVPMAPPPPGVTLVEGTATGDAVGSALLEYAEAHDIDLIVMGTHGRRGFAHVFFGSIAEAVVREASCPVLTVRVDAETDTAQPVTIRRILVPVDFSERSQVALEHATALAALYGATVDVLHAVDVPALPEVYDLGLIVVAPDLTERSRASLEQVLERQVPPEQRGEVLVPMSTPAPAILDAARDRETDLIVMTTHGLTGLKRFALGSVAERVVQRAPCAVLTVKSFGRSLLAEREQEGSTLTIVSGRSPTGEEESSEEESSSTAVL